MHEMEALRVQKERLEKRRASTALPDNGSLLKRAKLGGDDVGRPTPTSNAAHNNLATALNEMQKQNQVGYHKNRKAAPSFRL